LEILLQDVRFGLRVLIKKPGFTAVALITLALAIGANSAIFSVVKTVLFNSLPFKNLDRLVMVWRSNLQQGLADLSFTEADFVEYRDHAEGLDQLAGIDAKSFTLTGKQEPVHLDGANVSANLFSMLNVTPFLGRTFTPEEEQPGHNQVVVLTYSLWQTRFGADPNVKGRAVAIRLTPAITPSGPAPTQPPDETFEVIGVLPKDFRLPGISAELYIPLVLNMRQLRRVENSIFAIGRLKPGVSLSQADAELKNLAASLERQYPQTNKGVSAFLNSLRDQDIGDIRPTILLLMAGVGLVLLIACANVASLLLVRAAEREREMAVRTALGAARRRLVRQLLTESVLLSVLGGIIGIALANWLTRLLVAVSPSEIPRIKDVTIDLSVLSMTIALSFAIGIVFGLVPAFQISKSNLNEALKEGTRSAGEGIRKQSLRSVLVTCELSLALMLLIGAGLVVKSFREVRSVDVGFSKRNILTFQISLPSSKYTQGQQQVDFYRQALTGIRQLPGVEAAGTINILPLIPDNQFTPISIYGRPDAGPGEAPLITLRTVSPGFFQAMGIPVVSGEEFTDENLLRVRLVISESLAQRYFPGEDPVGKRIAMGPSDARGSYIPIIGVVKDVRQFVLTEPAPTLYLPYLREVSMTMAVRTRSNPLGLADLVRDQILAVDKDQPIYDIKTMEQRLSETGAVAKSRFRTTLLIAFAATALVLAAIGIYGVMAYSVTQRTRELGIRLALGAESKDVVKLILRHGVILTVLGLAIGIGAALGLTRLMSALLYGVSATDAVTFGGACVVLAAVALLASYVPARRATRIDPLNALHYE
jgi:putative ABC transport system permease protein